MRGVYDARPGITGLAQITWVLIMSTPRLLAEIGCEDVWRILDLRHYFRYIVLTVIGKGAGDRVKKVGSRQ